MRVWSWLRRNTVRAYKTLQIESDKKLGVRGKREIGQSQSVGEKRKPIERKVEKNTGIKKEEIREMIDDFGMR